jgi:anti-sigma B factor antagonist
MARPDADFRIVSPESAPHCVVKASGEIDISTGGDLWTVLGKALAAAPAKIVVDLEDVTFIDCSALGVLVVAKKRGRDRDIELLLRAPSRRIQRLLELTNLRNVLPTENGVHHDPAALGQLRRGS